MRHEPATPSSRTAITPPANIAAPQVRCWAEAPAHCLQRFGSGAGRRLRPGAHLRCPCVDWWSHRSWALLGGDACPRCRALCAAVHRQQRGAAPCAHGRTACPTASPHCLAAAPFGPVGTPPLLLPHRLPLAPPPCLAASSATCGPAGTASPPSTCCPGGRTGGRGWRC